MGKKREAKKEEEAQPSRKEQGRGKDYAMSDDGWREYQKLVLSELRAHSERLEKISEQICGHGEELAQLRVKAGIWGALAGTVTGLGAYVMSKLT